MELENALYYYGIQAKLPYSLLRASPRPAI